ncbi:hypothetical protein HMPREF1633_09340 [Tissierellia bacterium S5-A11]|nr:hypothetical protein HMPREF1633_09340 [Tissierellia bacterium S5-A11]
MEREIEVKLLGIDVDQLEERLKNLGGNFLGEEEQRNINIWSTRQYWPQDQGYLRLRTIKTGQGEVHEFTFKKQVSNQGVRDNYEYTTHIDDPAALVEILKATGFDRFDRGYKKRRSYTYKNCRFDFDQWDPETYPKAYVEIEAPSKETLYQMLDDLEIPKHAVSTLSIAQLKSLVKKQNKE